MTTNKNKKVGMGCILIHVAIKHVVAPLSRRIWVKKVINPGNIPVGGPFIVAANHQSYLDFISLIAVLPRKIYFLAAEKFWDSCFWRPLVACTGQIKVQREQADKQEAIDAALAVLQTSKVLGVFPQGGRSRNGEIEKTYTGVARLAIMARVPVVPIGIKGAFEVLPPQQKWPRFKRLIEINIGAPISLETYYGREQDAAALRQATNEIMAAIAALAGKKYLPE